MRCVAARSSDGAELDRMTQRVLQRKSSDSDVIGRDELEAIVDSLMEAVMGGDVVAFRRALQAAITSVLNAATADAGGVEERGEADRVARVLSATLQSLGALASMLGGQMVADRRLEIDPGSDDASPSAAQVVASVADVFNQASVATARARLDAQEQILAQAMTVLDKMMSKWDDETKAQHDAIEPLAKMLDQLSARACSDSRLMR